MAAVQAETVNSGKMDLWPGGLGLSDEVLALAELEKDPVFHNIAADKYGYYVSSALAMGREAAEELRGGEVRSLLEQAGVRYTLADAPGAGPFRIALRAQLDWSGKAPEITVYRHSMEQLLAAAQDSGMFGPLTMERITDIHLAHEYYHLLEYRSGRFTNEVLEAVDSRVLGIFRRRSTVLQTSEIAAHAFCKTLLGLPCLPSLLDNIYLIQTGALKAERFAQDVERWTSSLGGSGLHML